MTFHPLKEILTARRLSQLADAGSLKRGREYYDDDRVMGVSDLPLGFTATVVGSEPYRVKILLSKCEIAHQCTCPVGSDFCKHCVAATLAWLNPKSDKAPGEDPLVAIQAWLDSRPKEALVELLFDHAMSDAVLYERLSMKAARARAPKDAAGLKKLITQATTTRGFVDYQHSGAFADGILEALEAVEETIPADANTVIDLCEHALKRVKNAIGNVDDSNGELGTVLERIEAIHLAACNLAKPDPIKLAGRLFDLEVNGEYGEFDNTLDTYATLLGKEGSAEFQRLVRQKWAEREPHSRYGRLRGMVVDIAQRENNFDSLVEIYTREFTDYEALVRLCRQYGKHPEALEWARKGVAAHKDDYRGDRHRMLAEELAYAGRQDEAAETVWQVYARAPSIDAFLALQKFAPPDDWQSWRDKAVGHVRKHLAGNLHPLDSAKHRSLLVEIYLYEKNLDAAFAESDAGACTKSILQRLADEGAKTKPLEAAHIYIDKLVPLVLQYASNDAYRKATKMLLAAARLLKPLGRQEEFTKLLNEIRTRQKPRRNLIKLLDQTKWP
ncbi:MAG: hypothetical protein IT462_15330 [Planctomycetes bacterium]|nr:hypothetical protein [Planctomycetota bacterium]